MKIKLLATLVVLGISGNALAAICTPEKPSDYQTKVLSTDPALINLRADAPVSADIPIGTVSSSSLGLNIDYLCDSTEIYGERPIVGLVSIPEYPNMFKTNIEGIGVRFTSSAPDGTQPGPLPRPRFSLNAEIVPEIGSRVTSMNGRFNAAFYKLSNNISLDTNYPEKSLLFNAGRVGQNGFENVIVSIYNMNQVHIVSTPVCTVDKPLPVNFGDVNADNVRNGVVRPFQFGVVCKTDYNSYNVTASIKAEKATTDGKYIKVKDNKDNEDSLIIEITDDQKKPVMVDGSTKLDIKNLKSGQKANYGWTANLKKQNGKPYPAQGPFRATAIITLDIK